MKITKPSKTSPAPTGVLKQFKTIVAVGLLALMGAVPASAVDWFGYVSPDWNNADNWQGSLVPDATAAGVQTVGDGITTFTATITNNVVGRPSELVIGGWFATGRLDHQAGLLETTNTGWPPGWVLIGFGAQGDATYNLADTTVTNNSNLTGYGIGSGTLNIWSALFMGEPDGGNGNGVARLNINTTGSLTVTNGFNLGVSGWNATMNLDAGTVVNNPNGAAWQGQVWIPKGVNNNSNNVTTGILNMAGGTFTTGYRINVGSCDGGETYTNLVGILNLSGGTLKANGVNFWEAGVRVGANGGTGTINLNTNGTLECRYVFHEGTNSDGSPNGISILNFDGGTLKPIQNQDVFWDAFIGGIPNDPLQADRFLTAAIVKAGGAIFDTAGYNINVQQALLADTVSTGGGLTKNGNGTLTFWGDLCTNTFTGSVVVNGGTLYANIGGAANNRNFSHVSGITVNSGATLRSSGNSLFGWDHTQVKPITVNAGGTLTADANADVAVGVVTLAGGTLASLTTTNITDWGTWVFDGSGAIVATDDSVVSAPSVRMQGGAYIDVAAGKTLNFTGSINDANVGGQSSLVKSGGTGTLVLSGANTYSGNTIINAGTLELAQSFATLAPTSTVTIASSAVLNLTVSTVTNVVAGLVTNGVAAGYDLYSSANSSGFITGPGYLKVVAPVVGPSGPAQLTNSYSGGVLTLNWPSGVSWRLESQTNNLSTGLSPTGWGTVPGVSDGSATIPVDPAAPSVFYRLVYP